MLFFSASADTSEPRHLTKAVASVRLFESLLHKKNPILDQIRGLVLLSPPIYPRNKIFEPYGEKYLKYLKTKNDVGLVTEDVVPFGSSYIDEFRGQPSLDERLISIGGEKPQAKFYIFHGIQDFISNKESVKWLKSKLPKTIDLTFNDYEAKHFLNHQAAKDSATVVEDLLK